MKHIYISRLQLIFLLMVTTNSFPSSRPKRRERGCPWVKGIQPSRISKCPGVRGLIIALLLLPLIAFPQGKRANNWYFGWNAGITFNQGSPPVALTDSEMLAAFLTGSATISNTLGEMQFYSDGIQIWNKSHGLMLNAGIIGTNCEQGAIIVPQPDHPNIYYLFNAGRINSGTSRFTLQYSIIDMNLDNGNGAVVPGFRCIPLYDTIVDMFTAVLHQNQEDIWVMSHQQSTNRFIAFLVTSAGLITVPVESMAGSVLSQAWGGLMKFSPDGSKIVTTQNSFEILDFNNLTGVVSDNNAIHGPTGSSYYGAEFSPDNSVFYASALFAGIFQYDLSAGNEAQVLATEDQVAIPTSSSSLQLGPDGKIYISPNLDTYLSVINKPNIVGPGCEYEYGAIDLLGKMNNGRLPTFIQSYLADPKYTTDSHCLGLPTKFSMVNTHDIDSVLWEFNDPGNAPNDTSIEFNTGYTFSGPGTYYPKLTVWAGDYIKSVVDTVIIYEIPDPDLGPDTLICPGEVINLTLNAGPIGMYFWNNSPSPGDSTFIVTDAGEYKVDVNNHGCISSDTIRVLWFDLQQFVMVLSDDDHCGHDIGKLTIFPQIGDAFDYTYSINGVDYLDNGGLFTGLPADVYTITLRNQSGCTSTSLDITIEDIMGPDITSIATPATGFNDNGSITVITTAINLTFQLEGYPPQSENLFANLTANTYYVIVTDEFGCITRDTVVVESNQGILLVALADTARECLHSPANSDIKIARAKGLHDMEAVLYYNDLMLNCTNFNANEVDFPGITAIIYSSPSRIELSWNGTNAVAGPDTLLLGSLIFDSYDYGIASIEWDNNSAVTWFLDAPGDSIAAVLLPGEIEIHQIPKAAISGTNVLCEGENAVLYGDITGGTDPIEFKWLTPAGELTIDMIPIENATSAESGIYSFITSDKFHCVDTAWIDLQVVPLPVANFPEVNGTIWFEESYLLEATKGYASYEWSTGDTTWYITVTEEGHYSVILKNEQGCQSMDTVMMMNAMVPVIVPNAFTPNGDGLNDTFKPIVNTELVRQFSMSIYNKWGQLIYETRNASKGWNGEDALPGVYNWVISYENRVGKVSQMKGSVALVR